MTIKINQALDRIDPPTIYLEGQLINEQHGTYTHGLNTQTISTQEATISAGTDHNGIATVSVRKRGALAFRANVAITIEPDTVAGRFIARGYGNRDSVRDIVGKFADGKTQMNLRSETYYTTNGKDPTRTKGSLYTGAFNIRRNLSGHDNIILKARTYCQGKISKVRKVEFRIQRDDLTKV